MADSPLVTLTCNTGREVVVYHGPPLNWRSVATGHRQPTLKAYLQAGFVCLVTGAFIGTAAYEFLSHATILSPLHWAVAVGINELCHMGVLADAEEHFPRLMKALNVTANAGFLGVSLHHAAELWVTITEGLIGVAAARALLLNLRHEFGAHVGASVIKFVKICWKLLHGSDHRTGHV